MNRFDPSSEREPIRWERELKPFDEESRPAWLLQHGEWIKVQAERARRLERRRKTRSALILEIFYLVLFGAATAALIRILCWL